MTTLNMRRQILKGGLAAAGLGVIGFPAWMLPLLAQGEMLVPFADFPANFNPNPAPDRRLLDTRQISGPFTPKDQFFTTQHYGHPTIDPAAYRLRVSGLVNKPLALSLDDLRKMKAAELIAGFECSGNAGHDRRHAPQGARRHPERWDAHQVRRSARRRGAVAAGNAGPVDDREIWLEAFQLHVERRREGRAHAGFAGHRRHRQGAADRGGTRGEEDVPRG